MGRQHHVAAAFQHPKLVGQRLWCPTQIRLGDHVEDHLTGGGHLHHLWAEGPDPPADAKIQRAGAGHQPDIAGRGHPGAHGRGAEQPRDRTGHEQAPHPELERIFWAGLQAHASFPLAHEQLGQALQLLVAERLEVKRVERDRGRLVGHRTLLRLGMRWPPGSAINPQLASRRRAARPPAGRTNDCKVTSATASLPVEGLDLRTSQREGKRFGIAGRPPAGLGTGDRQDALLLHEPPQASRAGDLE
jgi:hypothetical protein